MKILKEIFNCLRGQFLQTLSDNLEQHFRSSNFCHSAICLNQSLLPTNHMNRPTALLDENMLQNYAGNLLFSKHKQLILCIRNIAFENILRLSVRQQVAEYDTMIAL